MEKIECAVIGAGVIGLAIARALARSGLEVVVLEKNSAFGMEISARNSEVIHAGLYYPKGSLKDIFCQQGKSMLYAYCEQHNIPFKKIGKLLLATSLEEEQRLMGIYQNAVQCGVDDLVMLVDPVSIAQLEPNVTATKAILSPSSGIIDTHQYMMQLLTEAEHHGAWLSLDTHVQAIQAVSDGYQMKLIERGQSLTLQTKYLVGACGLHATQLLESMDAFPQDKRVETYFCKGHYFYLDQKQAPFLHLIYPLPEKTGLGIHSTLDLHGKTKFGPDTLWIDDINYEVGSEPNDKFYTAIQRYWPSIPAGSLKPDYAGVRPKAKYQGKWVEDFVLQTSKDHGLDNLIWLTGIESPGLTASLAIAGWVKESLLKN